MQSVLVAVDACVESFSLLTQFSLSWSSAGLTLILHFRIRGTTFHLVLVPFVSLRHRYGTP